MSESKRQREIREELVKERENIDELEEIGDGFFYWYDKMSTGEKIWFYIFLIIIFLFFAPFLALMS